MSKAIAVNSTARAVVSDIDSAIGTLKRVNLNNCDIEVQAKTMELAAMLKLADEANAQARLHGVNLAKCIDRFIATYDSTHMQGAYRRAVGKWQAYCAGKGIDPFTAASSDADAFASDMQATLATSTANLAVNGTSVFYAMLTKWQIPTVTPFSKVTRAKSKAAPMHRVPAAADIEAAIKRARTGKGKVRTRTTSLVADAIEVLNATGLRVGALPTLKVNKDNTTYTAYSKGKPIAPRQVPVSIAHIDLAQWRGMDANRLTIAIRRAFCDEYSAHDLRHRFAIDLYRESGNDAHAVMIALNHSSLAITTIYLTGLGIV